MASSQGGVRRGAAGRTGRILRRLYQFVCNEAFRTVFRVGTVQYGLCMSCPRCPSQGNLGTTQIIPHYPAKLARGLGLPAWMYVIRLYPAKIAQDAFHSKNFGPRFRPTPEEERDFVNGLVYVDFHERLHVFLREGGLPPLGEEDAAIEALEAKLARTLYPEYGIAGPRPWHSRRCRTCQARPEDGQDDASTRRPAPWRPSKPASEVT